MLLPPLDEDEPYDRLYTIPNDLFKAGIRFSIGTLADKAGPIFP